MTVFDSPPPARSSVVRKNDKGKRVDYLPGEIEIIRAAIDEAAAAGRRVVDYDALMKAGHDVADAIRGVYGTRLRLGLRSG